MGKKESNHRPANARKPVYIGAGLKKIIAENPMNVGMGGNRSGCSATGNTENWKPTNPKDLVGCKKVPMSTMSCPVMMEAAVGMLEGALKYGKHNYRDEGVLAGTYYDAVMRHMMAWWEGEDIDEKSGLSHVTKAMTSLVVLRDAMIQGKFKDDRPIKTVDPEWMEKLNKHVEKLLVMYPCPELPYTEIPVRPIEIKNDILSPDEIEKLEDGWRNGEPSGDFFGDDKQKGYEYP